MEIGRGRVTVEGSPIPIMEVSKMRKKVHVNITIDMSVNKWLEEKVEKFGQSKSFWINMCVRGAAVDRTIFKSMLWREIIILEEKLIDAKLGLDRKEGEANA